MLNYEAARWHVISSLLGFLLQSSHIKKYTKKIKNYFQEIILMLIIGTKLCSPFSQSRHWNKEATPPYRPVACLMCRFWWADVVSTFR